MAGSRQPGRCTCRRAGAGRSVRGDCRVNPARLLELPWFGAASARGLIALLIFLTLLLSAAFGFADAYTPPLAVNWLRAATYGLACLNAAIWAMLLPNVLLAAYAARRLQMPGAWRDAHLSLAFYALLTIVLPVTLLGVMGGYVAVAAVELVIGAGLGMAFAALPSYCTSVFFLMAVVHGVVGRWLALPSDTQSGFLGWTVPLAVALWLAVGWLWQRALRPQATLDGLHAPMFFLVRLGKWQRLLGVGHAATDSQLSGQKPGWLRTTVDLRGTGPGNAVQSLRVALGENFMPQTRSSRMRKTVVGLLACLLIAGLLALQAVGDAERGQGMPLAMGIRFLVMACVPFISAVMAVVTANVLRQRWSRSNAELSLLALLPRLGDSAQVKRALLRASLPPTLYGQAILLVTSLLVAIWWQLGAESYLLLLLGQLCGAALFGVLVLLVFAGGRLSSPNLAALIVLGLLWFFLSLASVLVSHVPVPALGEVIAIGWVAAFVVLLWLGMRGWHALQQRPHAFLAA
ncbi:hypothetical protein PY254_16110 [Rhodanobacter sp. AS-Z3]|uniref:hypothetical protein n=1 Tax=Rhodanobacter sp. AS-Z3 TaxID=3031330 RepID=UPI00247A220B|nr:hypothetical protein [Rhodanobacter sp. AS-Z3]WEN14737.1 hypothetical protein PY254_16110 [Rhodanobacter sp. AS-Z3]